MFYFVDFLFFIPPLYVDEILCSLEFYFGLMQFGFGFFKLLFFFSLLNVIILNYRYNIYEYNFILLYSITWIIWCDYNHIIFLLLSFYFLTYMNGPLISNFFNIYFAQI